MLPLALLAGGLATRLGQLAREMPKALLPVAGIPFIDHQLKLLKRNGFRRVVICVGYLGEQIQEHVGDGARFEIEIEYSRDWPELLSTGGALKKALPLLGSRFMVLYGDSYLDVDYAAIVRAFEGCGQPALMTVYRNNDLYDASNVVFEEDRIIVYDKRIKNPEMRHIDYGLGVLSASVLGTWPADKFDLGELYADLARRDELAGFEVKKRFYEIGSTRGLEELNQLLSK